MNLHNLNPTFTHPKTELQRFAMSSRDSATETSKLLPDMIRYSLAVLEYFA